ncbi:MAG: CCA tRNA nucleotidyltransferase, partial [Gemmatimonadales bacterium]
MTVHFPESLPIPDEVLEIARKLEGAGHETWCVGGAVRDNLLLLENHDFDLATAATPDVVQRLFRRTVPIGVEHGTVAVLDRHGAPHEVTTFRKDVKTDGRHAVVEFGVSLDEDLARRDFTINAIAYHPIESRWRDLFGGAADLDAGVIRAVGDAGRRFREDYLRIVRALRFAARFGFTIEPATWEAARANVEGTAYLSAERVRDEWFKGLETAGRAGDLVRLWKEVGVLEVWLPEIGEREAGSGRREALDRFGERDPLLLTSYLSS